MARSRTNPETRRGELIAAAKKVFFENGVANSAVSDIVKAAGLAQGTFYLYFSAKTDIINAVVEQIADDMVDAIECSVTAATEGAVSKLLALRDAILAAASDPAMWELAEIYHRPENRAIHEQMADKLTPRLAPLVEGIVRQGVAENVFISENPRVAAWFIIGGFHALEIAFKDRTDISNALVDATNYALRALGYSTAAIELKVD